MVGMIVEITVIALLVVTIGYCVILNRKLARLRTGEQTMRETIGELVSATDNAQKAIVDLKEMSSETDRRLGHKLKQGDLLARELAARVGAGEAVVDRVAKLVSAARTGGEASRPAMRAGGVAASPAHDLGGFRAVAGDAA